MKKSYKRLLIFQIALFLVLILNSFISNILSGYNIVIFLVISLFALKFFIGFERDRNRFIKDSIYYTVVFLLLFFILYYIFGIFIGFAKTDNYYSWLGMKTFIIPIVLTIVLKEILRYMMLKKSEESKLFIIFSCILVLFLDLTNDLYYANLSSSYNIFVFIALTVLPAISTNIVCTYISLKTGYKPVILYLIVIELYQYLLPIIPNPSEYIASIVRLVVPIVLCYRLHVYFVKSKDEGIPERKKKTDWVALLIPLIVIIVSVYFTSGYFKYHAVAIATGSMESKINKGDVVIIEKMNSGYNKLEKGQIIAFDYHGSLIVHRIIKIVNKNNEIYFYTKGDNNPTEDGYPVTVDMVVGKVNVTIPFLGLPTVWLKEL